MAVLTADQISALKSGFVKLAMFADLDFATGRVRLFTGHGEVAALGETWHGVGALSAATQMEESVEGDDGDGQLTLSGLSEDSADEGAANAVLALIRSAVDEFEPDREVHIYFGIFDPATDQLIGEPFLARFGEMESLIHQETGESIAAVLSYRATGTSGDGQGRRTYTDADQRTRFPADTGLERAALTGRETVAWVGDPR